MRLICSTVTIATIQPRMSEYRTQAREHELSPVEPEDDDRVTMRCWSTEVMIAL